MKYDIYFHTSCFDGISSAAILSKFLNSRGDNVGKLTPITHSKFRKISQTKSKNSIAIVDFLYHPKAEIYFDHHDTTFLQKKWQKRFKNSILKKWDPKKPSCAGLIVRHIEKNFKYKYPKHIHELIKWTDIIDIANFTSPRQVVDFKIPAIKIIHSLSEDRSPDYQKFLVKSLRENSLKKIASFSRVGKLAKIYQNKLKASFAYFKKNIKVEGNTSFLDATKKGLVGWRFSAFYFYPRLNYNMTLLKRGDVFHISMGDNPWKHAKKINIGKLLRELYKGGGHSYVGGADFKTKNEALKATSEIAAYLNKHG